MSGYNKSKIVGVPDKELNEFTCGICQDIFNDPVMAQCCQQIYCKRCIGEWLTNNNTCPNDRKLLNKNDLIQVPRLVTNLLNDMQIKSEFQETGCKIILTISELSKHISICDYNPKRKCKLCGLGKSFDEQHDCIANLVIKNESMTDELERLRKEIVELKKENKTTGMASILTSVRSSMNEFKIRFPVRNITLEQQNFLFRKCKEAVLRNNSFTGICRWLSHYINGSAFILLSGRKHWHVNAFSPEGGETLVICDSFFRMEHAYLIIEVFTAANY